MAREYQDWIDFWHAGSGDYADFLRKRLPAEDGVLVDAPSERLAVASQLRAIAEDSKSLNEFARQALDRAAGMLDASGVPGTLKEQQR